MTTTGYLAVVAIGCALLGVLAGVLLAGWRAARARTPARSVTIADLVHRVLDSAHNGVVVLDRDGVIVLHNPRAVELGVVADDQVDERARTAAAQVITAGEPIEVNLSPLSPRRRQPEAVLADVRPLAAGFAVVDAADQSESVRLEATRRDFVANVSHELKTPVGALALLAEAVLGCADEPDEVRYFSKKISHEATRMGTLVSELIELSRLQGAERLPELAVVDVDAVVAEAHDRTALPAESAGIDVTTDAPSGLLVNGDRTLLVTALSNLVDNAIAYSPHASPVSISRRLVEGFAEIAVTDRGIGIATPDQQRVFERFYRVDKARSRATGGTGLGLAIVKHTAANHGGEVKLWSQPGVGSTFTLRIPAYLGDDAETRGATGVVTNAQPTMKE